MHFYIIFTLVFLIFTVSYPLLNFIGFVHLNQSTSFIERIHPVSLCVIFYFLISFPFKWASYFNKYFIIYHANIIVGFYWMIYAYFVNSHPASIPIVSYITPFLFLIIIINTSQDERKYLSRLIHIFMCLNSIVALCEFAFQVRLIPEISDYAGSEVRRANALLGHPLTNATITGVYILTLITNLKLYSSALFPSIAIILSLLSLAAYSGRVAAVVLFLFMIIELSRGEWLNNQEGKRQFNRFVAVFVALIALIVIASAAYQAGFFDQFISRFENDYGSAQTRWLAWDKINSSTLEQFLFGREEKYIKFVDFFGNKSAVGIEIFWLNILFYNGLIVALPLSIIFIIGLFQLRKEVSGRVCSTILYFLVCISSSVGLGGKTQLLAMFFAIIISLSNNSNKNVSHFSH